MRARVLSVADVSTVAVVGLGLLGHALTSRLVAAGHAVTGYDVLSEKVAEAVRLGARPVRSIAEAVAGADAVAVVLPSLATVEDAILGAGGIAARAGAGAAVIQMSTISPALTERLAREVAVRGLVFLDCPVSGTSAMVARGDGLIICGADPAAFARWRPLLESMLPRAVHVGPAGHAMVLKLVANLLVGVHSLAAAEALTMARKAGLDLDRALDVLISGAAGSRMLEVRGPMMTSGEFPAQMKLELFLKDLHLIQDTARDLGAPVPLTDVSERLYTEAFRSGHGALDLAVVVRALTGES
jgi:L-threonate 2-dehydrogenase